ncbi:DNA alkylation repair protein [Corallococcus llansteffanensis]|uniref:DNA alkylation repair protein n=1 Tax=Corallococcus llansteffanensis TaxID=2316731 RepID=A0A3A8P0X7_9BACT|nr:DNA alkylation repair protein [Corallococcus llansteffanensis]RKH50003.1 DNA alkylation repair protein [Corallococcus llansteffanensis]
MSATPAVSDELRGILKSRSNPRLAEATRRYFPTDVRALGVSNAEVRRIADAFVKQKSLSPEERLAVTEDLLAQATHHEEVLLGFAVVRKAVGRSFDEALLDRFRYWLEHSVWSWAQCDDLCLTVMYPFFLTRTPAITRIQHWTGSRSPWCRRAANVALVKFVNRELRTSRYMLPREVILGNAQRLLSDPEPYVQKSVGWLLKVAADHHREAVVGFIQENISGMQRDTLRYAIERLDPEQRKALLALEYKVRRSNAS